MYTYISILLIAYKNIAIENNENPYKQLDAKVHF